MLVVEIFSFHSGIRVIDKVEYPSLEAWEKDKLLLKLSGTWVGEKIYEISMDNFNELTETQRNNLPCKADFDKEAFLLPGFKRMMTNLMNNGEKA
jgi:hypothetical protein